MMNNNPSSATDHGAHLKPGSKALLQAARQQLTANNVRWTKLRGQVFEALNNNVRPQSAYDVAEQVSDTAGRRIAANSVYRILDLFVEHDLVKRVESRNAFVPNTHPACSHDCIFLICSQCDVINHIDDDTLAGAMRQRARDHGFRPKRAVLEMIGLCAECQKN